MLSYDLQTFLLQLPKGHMKETKICGNCKENKPRSEFTKCSRAKDGLQWHCKVCYNIYQIVYRYNLDLEHYLSINNCEICGKEFDRSIKEPHVDHCHETNEVRGIVCRNCNQMLGGARDNIETLRKAIDYLS